MNEHTHTGRHTTSPWSYDWFPRVPVTQSNQFPIFEPVHLPIEPRYATSFVRSDDCPSHRTSLIHGFVDDTRLKRLLSNPGRHVSRFADHLGVITPDFSIMLGMPIYDRMRSVHLSRYVGAYWQLHGLRVIPNVRWADPNDLEFALEGLPSESTIALSTQSLHSDWLLHKNFEEGLVELLETICPLHIILYGKPTKNFYSIIGLHRVSVLPTDKCRVHMAGDF